MWRSTCPDISIEVTCSVLKPPVPCPSTCRQVSCGHRPLTSAKSRTSVARRRRRAGSDARWPGGAREGSLQAGKLGRVPAEALCRRLRRSGDGRGPDFSLPARAIAPEIKGAFDSVSSSGVYLCSLVPGEECRVEGIDGAEHAKGT